MGVTPAAAAAVGPSIALADLGQPSLVVEIRPNPVAKVPQGLDVGQGSLSTVTSLIVVGLQLQGSVWTPNSTID